MQELKVNNGSTDKPQNLNRLDTYHVVQRRPGEQKTESTLTPKGLL